MGFLVYEANTNLSIATSSKSLKCLATVLFLEDIIQLQSWGNVHG